MLEQSAIPQALPDAEPAPARGEWRRRAPLYRYLRPHGVILGIALFAQLCGSGLRLLFPYLAGLQVDGTIQSLMASRNGPAAAHKLLPPTAPAWMYDITTMALFLFGIIVLIMILKGVELLMFARAGESAVAAVRVDAYRQVVHAPMAFHSTRRVGELGTHLQSDLTLLQENWVNDLPSAFSNLVLLLGSIALMVATSVYMSAVIFVVVPCAVGAGILLGRIVRRVSREGQDRLAAAGTIVEETLQGIQTVKAFATEERETLRYRGAVAQVLRLALAGARVRTAMLCTVLMLGLGTAVTVMWLGSRLVQEGQLTPGQFTHFMFYVAFAGSAAGAMADTMVRIQKSLGAADRVAELLREPTEEVLEATAKEDPDLPRPQGRVEFREVGFHYPSQPAVEVLRDLTFTVEPGQRVALVGPSGAGKSTIVSLVLRFFDPQQGQVLIDGRPAAEYPLHWLRRQMALVPQDPLLFGGSIRENIAYGRPQATQAEIEDAARRAHAHDFIAALPLGYETTVGERGMRLSGGQRQRIAIARAILKDPAILLLDEATSSLDAESEHHVQAALEDLMQGRTTFIIAHRLSTVREAGSILVIDAGRLVELGTHAQLMDHNGLYQRLCQRQLQVD
jgi:ATP-binding cassette subfamily B protein